MNSTTPSGANAWTADAARLFAALWPGPDLARFISALCGDCAGVCGSQVVATDSIHLTLHLQAELGDALRRVGLRIDEREFRPRLTVARQHFQSLRTPTGPPLRWLVDG